MVYGPWSKLFDAGWPPVIVAVLIALRWLAIYQFDATEAQALGIAALVGGIVATGLICAVNAVVDDRVSEIVSDASESAVVSAFYAAAAAVLIGVFVTSPLMVSISCSVLLLFFGGLLYRVSQDNMKIDEWQWGWRKAVMSAGLVAGYFAKLQWSDVVGFAVLVAFLIVQFMWTYATWPRKVAVGAT